MAKLKLVVKVPWWASIYIHSCALLAKTFGVEPDIDRVVNTIIKRVKVKAE